jgi:general stress protein 26
MGQAKDNEKAEQNFFEMLKKFDNAVLVTHTDHGSSLHARPMAIAETSEDGSIWFITGSDTPKIDEIEHNPGIVAVMQQPKQWLAVTGRGEVHRDRARIHKVWKEAYRAWFDGKDDPNIVLIRLNPTAAEYWDNAGLAGVKFALKFAAAYVTGKEMRGPNDVNTHGKVSL